MPDAPNTPDIAEVEASLTTRPRMALLAWPDDTVLTWIDAVGLASRPGDRRIMSYRSVLGALERRGLAEMVFPGRYDPVSRTYEERRFGLTPLGIAVRDYLRGQGS